MVKKTLIHKLEQEQYEVGIQLTDAKSPSLVKGRIECTQTGELFAVFTEGDKRINIHFSEVDIIDDTIDTIWFNPSDNKFKWFYKGVYGEMVILDLKKDIIRDISQLHDMLLQLENKEITKSNLKNTIFTLADDTSDNSTNIVSENSKIKVKQSSVPAELNLIGEKGIVTNSYEGIVSFNTQSCAPLAISFASTIATISMLGDTTSVFRVGKYALAYEKFEKYKATYDVHDLELKQELKPSNTEDVIFSIGEDLSPNEFEILGVNYDSLTNITEVSIETNGVDITFGRVGDDLNKSVRFIEKPFTLKVSSDANGANLSEARILDLISTDTTAKNIGTLFTGERLQVIAENVKQAYDERCTDIVVKKSENEQYWLVFAVFTVADKSDKVKLFYSRDGLKTLNESSFNHRMGLYNDGRAQVNIWYFKHDNFLRLFSSAMVTVTNDGRFAFSIGHWDYAYSRWDALTFFGIFEENALKISLPSTSIGGFVGGVAFEKSNVNHTFMTDIAYNPENNLLALNVSRSTEDAWVQFLYLDFGLMEAKHIGYGFVGTDFARNYYTAYFDFRVVEDELQLIRVNTHSNGHLYCHKVLVGDIVRAMKASNYTTMTYGSSIPILAGFAPLVDNYGGTRNSLTGFMHEVGATQLITGTAVNNEDGVIAIQTCDTSDNQMHLGFIDYGKTKNARFSHIRIDMDKTPDSGSFDLSFEETTLATALGSITILSTDTANDIRAKLNALASIGATPASGFQYILAGLNTRPKAKYYGEVLLTIPSFSMLLYPNNETFNLNLVSRNGNGISYTLTVEAIDGSETYYTYSNYVVDGSHVVGIGEAQLGIVREKTMVVKLTTLLDNEKSQGDCSIYFDKTNLPETYGTPTTFTASTLGSFVKKTGNVIDIYIASSNGFTPSILNNTMIDDIASPVVVTPTVVIQGSKPVWLKYNIVAQATVAGNNYSNRVGKSFMLRETCTEDFYLGLPNYAHQLNGLMHAWERDNLFYGKTLLLSSMLRPMEIGGTFDLWPTILKVPNFEQSYGKISSYESTHNYIGYLGNSKSNYAVMGEKLAQRIVVPNPNLPSGFFPMRTLELPLRISASPVLPQNEFSNSTEEMYVTCKIVNVIGGFPDEGSVLATSTTKWPISALPALYDTNNSTGAYKYCPFVFDDLNLTPTSEVAFIVEIGGGDLSTEKLGLNLHLMGTGGTFTDNALISADNVWTALPAKFNYKVYDHYTIVIPFNLANFKQVWGRNRPTNTGLMRAFLAMSTSLIGNKKLQCVLQHGWRKSATDDRPVAMGSNATWCLEIEDTLGASKLPMLSAPSIVGYDENEYDEHVTFGHAFGVIENDRDCDANGRRLNLLANRTKLSHMNGFTITSSSTTLSEYKGDKTATVNTGIYDDTDFKYERCVKLNGQFFTTGVLNNAFIPMNDEFVIEFEFKPHANDLVGSHVVLHDQQSMAITFDEGYLTASFRINNAVNSNLIVFKATNGKIEENVYGKYRISRSRSYGVKLEKANSKDGAFTTLTLRYINDVSDKSNGTYYEITGAGVFTETVCNYDSEYAKRGVFGLVRENVERYVYIGRNYGSASNFLYGCIGYIKVALASSTFKYDGIGFSQRPTIVPKAVGNFIFAFKFNNNSGGNFKAYISTEACILRRNEIIDSKVYTPPMLARYAGESNEVGLQPKVEIDIDVNEDTNLEINGLVFEFSRK